MLTEPFLISMTIITILFCVCANVLFVIYLMRYFSPFCFCRIFLFLIRHSIFAPTDDFLSFFFYALLGCFDRIDSPSAKIYPAWRIKSIYEEEKILPSPDKRTIRMKDHHCSYIRANQRYLRNSNSIAIKFSKILSYFSSPPFIYLLGGDGIYSKIVRLDSHQSMFAHLNL